MSRKQGVKKTEKRRKIRRRKKWRGRKQEKKQQSACIWLHNCSTGFETGSAQKTKQKTASKQKRFHCHRTTATSNLPNHCGNFITRRWNYQKKKVQQDHNHLLICDQRNESKPTDQQFKITKSRMIYHRVWRKALSKHTDALWVQQENDWSVMRKPEK